ncbi:ArsR/SmtB family transcription factor [Lacticaseibacillus absianus]|uniref:ArsR/SmtB family transcription factor n=1 Tax=Lacticaseibacillus absianus TaxID=2729623 RepID=UPI001C549D98|nr:helix-turn-helix transcriptional regulator [Lacticaseibacillus absianus]
MPELPDVSALARLLADPTRGRLLDLLMDGQAHTALELARAGGVTPQTGTYHLHKLVELGVVTTTCQGRHHYFMLADPTVAAAFETLSGLVPARPVQALSRRRPAAALAYARTCYDHLAGTVGVAICDAMQAQGLLRVVAQRFVLTPAGEGWLQRTLAIEPATLAQQSRQLTVRCLDWSQRRYHLGGAVGHAMLVALEAREVLTRGPARAVSVTPSGRRWCATTLGLTLPAAPQ